MTKDNVNHPPHYTAHPSGIECIEVTRHMNFNLGNAVKYIWRAGLKNDALEDLEKAAFYIQDEINRLLDEKVTGESYVQGVPNLAGNIVSQGEHWKSLSNNKCSKCGWIVKEKYLINGKCIDCRSENENQRNQN